MISLFKSKFSNAICALLAVCFSHSALASTDLDSLFPSKTVYIGANVGGGSTEWKYLVDTKDPNNPAKFNLPDSVTEGGPSWGAAIGYDLSKNFAIEVQYVKFANAKVNFNKFSPYNLVYHIMGITSQTDAFALDGKFFVQLPKTRMRAFAAVGAGLVRRKDVLATTLVQPVDVTSSHEISCLTPYMSAGANYTLSRHWMLESAFQYFTGFGVSEIHPVYGFVPFAWDAYFRVAYQF